MDALTDKSTGVTRLLAYAPLFLAMYACGLASSIACSAVLGAIVADQTGAPIATSRGATLAITLILVPVLILSAWHVQSAGTWSQALSGAGFALSYGLLLAEFGSARQVAAFSSGSKARRWVASTWSLLLALLILHYAFSQ
jgi:hypothetical protein